MKKKFTKGDYKRKKREVKRTSGKLLSYKNKRKFKVGDIVRLKEKDDMGYVEEYRYDKVIVKWVSCVDIHYENDLIKVV